MVAVTTDIENTMYVEMELEDVPFIFAVLRERLETFGTDPAYKDVVRALRRLDEEMYNTISFYSSEYEQIVGSKEPQDTLLTVLKFSEFFAKSQLVTDLLGTVQPHKWIVVTGREYNQLKSLIAGYKDSDYYPFSADGIIGLVIDLSSPTLETLFDAYPGLRQVIELEI